MIAFGTNLEPFVALTSEKHPDDILVESDTLFSLNWKRDTKIVIVQQQPNSFLSIRKMWSTFMCTWLIMEISICLFSLTLHCNNQAANWFRQAYSTLVWSGTSPVLHKDYSIPELPGKLTNEQVVGCNESQIQPPQHMEPCLFVVSSRRLWLWALVWWPRSFNARSSETSCHHTQITLRGVQLELLG